LIKKGVTRWADPWGTTEDAPSEVKRESYFGARKNKKKDTAVESLNSHPVKKRKEKGCFRVRTGF